MKNLALCLLILISSLNLYSQNCVPDQSITKPGIYPSYLDTGMVDVSYEHTLQILAVKDTMVNFNGNTINATVDSVKIVSINGLPAGFSYSCEPPRCVFTHQSVGCAKLVGNPVQADKGEHPLEIIVTSYARYLSFKLPVTDTIRDFTLVINDSTTASIHESISNQLNISPNPISGNLLKVSVKERANKVLIMNGESQVVIEQILQNQTDFGIDISSLAPGIYYLRVFSDQSIQQQKFIRIE